MYSGEPKCHLCGSKDGKIVRQRDGYEHKRCNVCDLLFVSKSPKEYKVEVYDENYYFFDPARMNEDRKRSRKLVRLIQRLLPDSFNFDEAELLDVGCGKGIFLDEVRKLGLNVTGLETAEKAADFARSKFDLEVVHSPLEDFDFSDQKFDVITMWEVIEHLTEPQQVVDKLLSWLKPGGYLILSTPNAASLTARVFGQNCAGGIFDIPQYHVSLFSPASMQYMFGSNHVLSTTICTNKTKYINGIIKYSIVRKLLHVNNKYLSFAISSLLRVPLWPVAFIVSSLKSDTMNNTLITVARRER